MAPLPRFCGLSARASARDRGFAVLLAVHHLEIELRNRVHSAAILFGI
jgi:hypothetical protein